MAISFVLTQSLTKVKTVRDLFQPPRYTPEVSYKVSNTQSLRTRLCMNLHCARCTSARRELHGLVVQIPKGHLWDSAFCKILHITCWYVSKGIRCRMRPVHSTSSGKNSPATGSVGWDAPSSVQFCRWTERNDLRETKPRAAVAGLLSNRTCATGCLGMDTAPWSLGASKD